MNSTNSLLNFKHDIVGRFKDVNSMVSTMDESVFEDSENNELFHAIHEVLLRMVKTSKSTISNNLKQEMVLLISEEKTDLTRLHIEGVVVRYELSPEKIIYHYSIQENPGDLMFNLGKAMAVLPIKRVESDDPFIRERLKDTNVHPCF